ncbi:hypothetical protein GCM10009760_30290 [Kitasatospora kazusensis]|uniref:Sec-independent protein translocase protein TatA n=1 Tax=Kitasatospora kazusensis TaxID=407974 RepID=A0ABN2ZKH4_9ACTN
MFRNGLEPWHLVVLVSVVVLLFGSKRLPEAARGLGRSLRILKAETAALREDDGVPPGDGADRPAAPTAAPPLPASGAAGREPGQPPSGRPAPGQSSRSC